MQSWLPALFGLSCIWFSNEKWNVFNYFLGEGIQLLLLLFLLESMNIGQIITQNFLLTIFFHFFSRKKMLLLTQMPYTTWNIRYELGIILSTSVWVSQARYDLLWAALELTSAVQHVILIWFFQGPTVIVFVV